MLYLDKKNKNKDCERMMETAKEILLKLGELSLAENGGQRPGKAG